MTYTIDTYTHTAESGRGYRITIHPDTDTGTPWDECDGYGSIRTVYQYYGHPEKHAGEVVIYEAGGTHWLYDFAGAVKTARRDKRGSVNCTPDMSPGARAAQAAKDDAEYCRKWLAGDLFYVGVCVTPTDADGDQIDPPPGAINSLWGVEYGYGRDGEAYAKETALELIGELEHAATREAEESAHWAARDVLTA